MRTRLQFYILSLLLSLIFIAIVIRIFNSFIDFDEGYFLVVAQHFHDQLSYSSNTMLFDPLISTGPTVILPAALLVSFNNPLLPRLVMLIYSFSLIIMVLKFSNYSFRQKIIYLILLFFTPLYFFFSSHILGEIPAFAFFFTSLVFLTKKKFLPAGFFLGLALLTKSNYLLAIPIVMIYLLIRHSSVKTILGTFLSILLPILIWQLVHLASFSFQIQSYIDSLFNFFQYFINYTGMSPLSIISNRINMFEYVFTLNGYIVIFLILFIFSWTLIQKSLNNRLISLVSFFGLIYFIYYLFVNNTASYRHFLPVVLSLTIVIPSFMEHFLKKLTKDYLFFLGILISVIAINIYTNRLNDYYLQFKKLRLTQQGFIFYDSSIFLPFSPDILLQAQLKTADYIRHRIPGNRILSGIGWWSAPEISYLSHRKINSDPSLSKNAYFVTDLYAEIFGTYQMKTLLQFPHRQVFSTDMFYNVYQKISK